jgi:hypothetical protein
MQLSTVRDRNNPGSGAEIYTSPEVVQAEAPWQTSETVDPGSRLKRFTKQVIAWVQKNGLNNYVPNIRLD